MLFPMRKYRKVHLRFMVDFSGHIRFNCNMYICDYTSYKLCNGCINIHHNLTRWILLLMEEILHQLISSLSHYLQGFRHPRWCRISSINSMGMAWTSPVIRPTLATSMALWIGTHAWWRMVVGMGNCSAS